MHSIDTAAFSRSLYQERKAGSEEREAEEEGKAKR